MNGVIIEGWLLVSRRFEQIGPQKNWTCRQIADHRWSNAESFPDLISISRLQICQGRQGSRGWPADRKAINLFCSTETKHADRIVRLLVTTCWIHLAEQLSISNSHNDLGADTKVIGLFSAKGNHNTVRLAAVAVEDDFFPQRA